MRTELIAEVGLYLGVNSSGTKYKFIVNMGAGSIAGCGLTFGCAEGGTVTSGWQLGNSDLRRDNSYALRGRKRSRDRCLHSPSARRFPLYVGGYYAGGFGWNGSVDDIRLYNRVLTASEVASI